MTIRIINGEMFMKSSHPFLKKCADSICRSPLAPVFKCLYDWFTMLVFTVYQIKWFFQGYRKPTKDNAREVAENVTFIYKSFERQTMAKRLYRQIQRYYPTARVVIADDSRKPLALHGKYVTVIQLPFNQGISVGLNRCLEQVKTPFTMRIDDDMLLTPLTNIHDQLTFLNHHLTIDLVAVQACSPPILPSPQEAAKGYLKFNMKHAPKPLLIPHKTKIDDTHYVLGKTCNIFLIRTDKYRTIGYDNHIRIIDHHEFFWRAAGVLVAATDISAFVFHYHNRFDVHYSSYRSDYRHDVKYIKEKHLQL